MKLCLTGGIACGKSLLSHFLNDLGVVTVDADDIVHELIPAEERRRLAAKVFADPVARKALEARLHPLVKAELQTRLAAVAPGQLAMAVVPLLFEAHWEGEFDTVICVASTRENQLKRMTDGRGYSLAEAEGRLAAQLPVEEKAARSHYVIHNDGTAEELRAAAAELVAWLKNRH